MIFRAIYKLNQHYAKLCLILMDLIKGEKVYSYVKFCWRFSNGYNSSLPSQLSGSIGTQVTHLSPEIISYFKECIFKAKNNTIRHLSHIFYAFSVTYRYVLGLVCTKIN